MNAKTNTAKKPETQNEQSNKKDENQVQTEMRKVITDEHKTVSAKIRALDAAGYTRSQIANFLGKRYQHVRNVLVTPLKANTEGQKKTS